MVCDLCEWELENNEPITEDRKNLFKSHKG
jgi:hypothetical protein